MEKSTGKAVVFDCDGTLINHKKELCPGVYDLVKKLSSENYNLFVWTGRDRISTIQILSKYQISKYFIEISCCDDTTPKPHPSGLENLVSTYEKENVLLVGDTSSDVHGAQNYGISCLAVLWDSTAPSLTGASLMSEGAWTTAVDANECYEKICEFFRK